MTTSIPLQFDRIVPCSCANHAVVQLFDARRGTRVQVRVTTGCAEAIEAVVAGRESLPCSLIDTLISCMEAGGNVPVELVLAQHSGEALMHLRTESQEDVYVPVDPGMGYLVAHQLRLAVVLSRASRARGEAGDDPLAAFRQAVEGMDWPLDEVR
jgi:hypothetical protein